MPLPRAPLLALNTVRPDVALEAGLLAGTPGVSPGDNLLGDRLNCPGEDSGVGLVLGYEKAGGE